MITALAGGVGAARFLTGLVRLVKGEDLSIVVNTGDDIDLFGLHISPDVDIVMYTLAGESRVTRFTVLKRLGNLAVKHGLILAIRTLQHTCSGHRF
jgi:hypothetical protein